MLLRRVSTSAGPEPVCASERSMPRVADMSSAAAVPLPETSARTRPQRPSRSGMKSYQSPPTEPAESKVRTRETRNQRRAARQQSLLNGARFFGLAAHALALFALIAKAPGVVHCDGDVSAQSLQQPQLIGAKSVQFAMGSGENSDQIALALQRDGDFGARIGLAGHVVRIASDVGSVVHFAGGCDVAHHSGAFFEVMALAVNAAAANAGEYEFRLFRIAKIEVDFDAAERVCNLIDDPRNQFFEVESGGDALREFLQAHQFGEPSLGRFRERLAEKPKSVKGRWTHKTLLPV
jgi:hypothetical protein